jgi:response regulator RpfG family c-di-GMP phosphodiesterase
MSTETDYDDLFIEENEIEEEIPKENWKIMVVDDESDVHEVTKLALKQFSFNGRGLEIISAYSGNEACRIIEEHPDTVMILLDVVMESDTAGLDVVKFIRDTLQNTFVRIVLRTGQPGVAPAQEVILNYDINDYKDKSELTSERLFTTVIASLRAYQDIITIEENSRSLEELVRASSSIFELDSSERLISNILGQLNNILGPVDHSFFCGIPAFYKNEPNKEPILLAGTGKYESLFNQKLADIISPDQLEDIKKSYSEEETFFVNNRAIVYFKSKNNLANVAFVEECKETDKLARKLVDVFSTTAASALDNLHLFEQFCKVQKSAVNSLLNLAKQKDEKVGNFMQGVAELAMRIAHEIHAEGRLKESVSQAFVKQIGLASILHDIGNVGILYGEAVSPANDEFDLSSKSTSASARIFEETAKKTSGRNYLTMAAEIAIARSERYDGSGYPNGISGDSIPLSARIISVAEFFINQTTRLAMPEGWPYERTMARLNEEAGQRFDPLVVETLQQSIKSELEWPSTWITFDS